MLQNTVSGQDLHCLPPFPQFLDTSTYTYSKTDLFVFKDKYGKNFRCLNINACPAEPRIHPAFANSVDPD